MSGDHRQDQHIEGTVRRARQPVGPEHAGTQRRRLFGVATHDETQQREDADQQAGRHVSAQRGDHFRRIDRNVRHDQRAHRQRGDDQAGDEPVQDSDQGMVAFTGHAADTSTIENSSRRFRRAWRPMCPRPGKGRHYKHPADGGRRQRPDFCGSERDAYQQPEDHGGDQSTGDIGVSHGVP